MHIRSTRFLRVVQGLHAIPETKDAGADPQRHLRAISACEKIDETACVSMKAGFHRPSGALPRASRKGPSRRPGKGQAQRSTTSFFKDLQDGLEEHGATTLIARQRRGVRARHTKVAQALYRGPSAHFRLGRFRFPVLSEGSCRRRIGALRGRRSVLSRRSERPLSRASHTEPHHPDRAVAGCRELRERRGQVGGETSSNPRAFRPSRPYCCRFGASRTIPTGFARALSDRHDTT